MVVQAVNELGVHRSCRPIQKDQTLYDRTQVYHGRLVVDCYRREGFLVNDSKLTVSLSRLSPNLYNVYDKAPPPNGCYPGHGNQYDSAGNGSLNGNATTRHFANLVWELRIRRALRRLHDWTVITLRRRCEMRLFIALRVQFLYRARTRRRAAAIIQRFYRKRTKHPRGALLPHNTA